MWNNRSTKARVGIIAVSAFVIATPFLSSTDTTETTTPTDPAAVITTELTTQNEVPLEELDPIYIWALADAQDYAEFLTWMGDHSAGLASATTPLEMQTECADLWLEMLTRYEGDVDYNVSESIASMPDHELKVQSEIMWNGLNDGLSACALGDFETGSANISASAEALSTLELIFTDLADSL